MAIVAPQVRKHVSADARLRLVHRGFAHIPDHRPADAEIALTDALLSALALFSLKAPSLLAFDKERAEGKVHTIYGSPRVPCDTPLRAILDPLSPKVLRPVCTRGVWPWQRGKALAAMPFLDDHSLWALDGTGYFSSQTMHGASCLQKGHRKGSITSLHQLLGAAIIHPALRAVMPLLPEPLVQPDGTDKHDGERKAAKRFVATLRQDPPHLQCLVTADSRSAQAPHIATLQAYGLHDIWGSKEGEQASLLQDVQAAAHAGRVTYDARHDRATHVVHRFRLLPAVPLQASHPAVRVNVIAYGESGQGKVQPCSGVTDLRVRRRTVLHLRRGGRARWKIAHETCTTRHNQGDHFEHPDGHGEQHLAGVFAVLLRLAFLGDQAQQRCGALFQAVWTQLGSKRLRWERMSALLYDDALASMRQLCAALWYGCTKSSPLVAIDASSSAPVLL